MRRNSKPKSDLIGAIPIAELPNSLALAVPENDGSTRWEEILSTSLAEWRTPIALFQPVNPKPTSRTRAQAIQKLFLREFRTRWGKTELSQALEMKTRSLERYLSGRSKLPFRHVLTILRNQSFKTHLNRPELRECEPYNPHYVDIYESPHPSLLKYPHPTPLPTYGEILPHGIATTKMLNAQQQPCYMIRYDLVYTYSQTPISRTDAKGTTNREKAWPWLRRRPISLGHALQLQQKMETERPATKWLT